MVRKKVTKRASTPRPYNAGTMSEAEFKSFILSWLRDKSRFWKPKTRAIARARIWRNLYKCEECWKEWPWKIPPLPWNKRERKNIQADHTREIVPVTWFEWFDSWIERCFIEEEWYKALCWECHSWDNWKTKTENKERKAIKDGEEVWRKINEFPEKEYYISNLWNFKNWDIKKSILDNWNWYKQVSIWHSLKRYVHRLVADSFIWDVKGLVVCHKDDNPSNNRMENLFIWTTQDNIDDKIKKGRHIVWGKTIFQYSKDWVFIKEWKWGAWEIKRDIWYDSTSIYHCCYDKYKQSSGYVWRWRKEFIFNKEDIKK